MKNKIIKCMCSLVLMPLFYSVTAQAVIYKCTNASKDVYYNDKPCPVDDIERQLKEGKDPVNGYVPPAYVEPNVSNPDVKSVSKNKSTQSAGTAKKETSKTERLSSDKQAGSSENVSSGGDHSMENDLDDTETESEDNDNESSSSMVILNSNSDGKLNIISREPRD